MTNFCFSFMHLDTLLLHICFMSPFGFFIGHQQSCVRHLCNCIFIFHILPQTSTQTISCSFTKGHRCASFQAFTFKKRWWSRLCFHSLFWRVLGQAIIAMCGLMTKRNFYMISFTAHIFNGSIKVYS